MTLKRERTGSDAAARGAVARYVAAPLGSLPVVGPPLQEASIALVRAVLDEHARLHSTAISAAEIASGMSREDMAEQLIAHPQTVPLAARVLWHAGMTNQDEILEILGCILGSILLAPDDSEEAELILLGIGDLRRIHLQVLRVMSGDPLRRVLVEDSYSLVEKYEAAKDSSALPPRNPDADGYVSMQDDHWNAEAIAFDTGLSLTRTQLALAGLVKAGFANAPHFTISPAGELVLEVIQRYQAIARVKRPPVHIDAER